MKDLNKSFKKVCGNFSSWVMGVLFFLIFSFLEYFLLTRTTSWASFLADNNGTFVFLSVIFSFINNLLLAIAFTFIVYIIEAKKKLNNQGLGNSLIGTFLGLISVGCAVCGGFLLPLVGVAVSLTAFPFQGLEIKALSILVLIYAIFSLSEIINGKLKQKKNYGLLIGIVSLALIYFIPRLPWNPKTNFFGGITAENKIKVASGKRGNLFEEINPSSGYEMNSVYGDLGPKMITSGVIDINKFKDTYQKAGQLLTKEQLKILTQGSNEKIKITRENSYFLLNFFWAVGLNNQSKILTEGDIIKYGEGQTGNFASTGGWTLGAGDPMNYYSKQNLINLTDNQEKLVEKVASNIYRPCCNNSTAFPDCNHGMALLGVLQLLASNNATESQMFDAAKYINAYWFPSNYYEIALYFKNKDNKDFKDISGETILGKNYSSSSGWSNVKQWLVDHNIVEKPPQGGGGCGV